MSKSDYDRGKIAELILERPIEVNGNKITRATIEIDHINYGLDKKTKKLKKRKRTNFNLRDIGKFILLLDGEYIEPIAYNKTISRHKAIIDCPISGRFHNKEFLMIFELDYKKSECIYTLTLIPNWRNS